MADLNVRGAYKARKTPGNIYTSSPPATPATIEVLYRSIDHTILDGTEELFRDKIVTSQVLYRPAILASARVNFHGNRWNVHAENDIGRLVLFPSKHQLCEWNSELDYSGDQHNYLSVPEPDSLFAYDSSYDFSQSRFEELQDEFRQHLIATIVLTVEYNPHLKLERKLDESEESFQLRCLEQARAEFQKETHNLEDTILRLQDRLKQRSARAMLEPDAEEGEKDTLSGGNAAMAQIHKEMKALEELRKTKMNELEERVAMIAKEREKDVLRLHLGNLAILRFALVWLPYTEYVIQEDDSRRLHLVQSF